MKLITAIIVAAVLVTALGSPGFGGTVIRCTVQALDPSAAAGEVTIYLEPDRARLEFKNEDMRQAAIYLRDGDKPLLLIVDENSWTYRELDKKILKKTHGKVMDEVEAFEEELRRLPKKEREETRAGLRHALSRLQDIVHPKKSEKFTYEKDGDTHEVRSWTCERYAAYYEGRLEHVFEVAEWSDVDISYDEVKILVEMRESFGDVAMELGFVTMWSRNVSGFPVRMESYEDEILMDVTWLRDVKRRELDPNLFKVSKNYDKHPFFESSRDGSGSGLFMLIGGTGGSARSSTEGAQKRRGYK